jgi:predicted NAD/FAD-dependent oxidoreductase
MDTVVIGAGLSGLVCAQALQFAGLRVAVVDKSRGLGGRLATRRLAHSWADHGVRYLHSQGVLSQALIQTLGDRHLIHPWQGNFYTVDSQTNLQPIDETEPRYVTNKGATSVAKFLAKGLSIYPNQRVESLQVKGDRTWQLVGDSAEPLLDNRMATSLVVAIPAPQAAVLLEPLVSMGYPSALLQAVQAVEFDPCITAIASYAAIPQSLDWTSLIGVDSSAVAWVSLESSKLLEHPAGLADIEHPTVVVQSSPAFAQEYLDATDLAGVGQHLLHLAAAWGGEWLTQPEQVQVHRWRYAQVRRAGVAESWLSRTPAPLVLAGDWCCGRQIEAALQSGLDAANALLLELESERHTVVTFADVLRSLPG